MDQLSLVLDGPLMIFKWSISHSASNIFAILRFEQYNNVISADVEKMHRMIWLNPKQRHLQRIFWRFNPAHSLKVYTLNTVT